MQVFNFRKTYRKNIVWGSHAKRNALNSRILLWIDRTQPTYNRFEAISFPLPEKRVMPSKPKRMKQAKWGRNKQ